MHVKFGIKYHLSAIVISRTFLLLLQVNADEIPRHKHQQHSPTHDLLSSAPFQSALLNLTNKIHGAETNGRAFGKMCPLPPPGLYGIRRLSAVIAVVRQSTAS